MGALDFVDITKSEKKKIVYRWLFFAANFRFKKTSVFQQLWMVFKAKFDPILQNKKTERKNTAQCPYLQSTTNLAALLATIMSSLVGYLSSSATF